MGRWGFHIRLTHVLDTFLWAWRRRPRCVRERPGRRLGKGRRAALRTCPRSRRLCWRGARLRWRAWRRRARCRGALLSLERQPSGGSTSRPFLWYHGRRAGTRPRRAHAPLLLSARLWGVVGARAWRLCWRASCGRVWCRSAWSRRAACRAGRARCALVRRRVHRLVLARCCKGYLGELALPVLDLLFGVGDLLDQLLTFAQVLVVLPVAFLLEVFGRQQALGRGLGSYQLVGGICPHLRSVRNLLRGSPRCTTETSSRHAGRSTRSFRCGRYLADLSLCAWGALPTCQS